MKKAQVLSLDLLLALIIIVFGLGLLIQSTETRIYSQKQELAQNELETIGKNASMLLAGSPQITCPLTSTDSSIITHLPNCIDLSKVNSASLGIPSGYAFGVFYSTTQILLAGTAITQGANAPANVFAEQRAVVTYSGPVPKSELEICMGTASGTCGLVPKAITISVWRQ